MSAPASAFPRLAHELGHGVTDMEAGLQYLNQPGALNESLSDVWGSLVKQWVLQQTADQADWLIGVSWIKEPLQIKAIRSLKAPGTAFDNPLFGKDPQPAHMDNFVRLPADNDPQNDNGGVHINSGIPNHAFYLVAANLGGFAWEKAGRIWYATVHDAKVRRTTGFKAFARRTLVNAGKLFGDGSSEQKTVQAAWQQVGVLQ